MKATPAEFMGLFPEFRAPSWSRWREVLESITPATRELVCVCGRGSGKSRICALLAAWASAREYSRPEPVFVGVFGPSMSQSRLTFDYVRGFLSARPELRALVTNETAGRVELRGNVVVECIAASVAAPRGRSYALAIIEEAAFLPTEGSANPDVELLRAIRPALARVPGSVLAVVSSPYARRGILWSAAKRASEGKDRDGRVLYVSASTSELNPLFDREAIEVALAEDPVGARSEFLAEFRRDIESFVSREAVEACGISGRTELPPVTGITYTAFVDPSGGSRDSFTLAIGHHEERDGQSVAVVDCLRERRAPFSPESVVAEFAKVLAGYGIDEITGDRYGGEWPAEAFRRQGIEYQPAGKAKSDLYRDALALINGQRLELPDSDRLVTQLVSLERRTARGGRDSIDHPPSGRDDLANVVAGLAVGLTMREPQDTTLTWGTKRGGIWGRGTPAGGGVAEVVVGLRPGRPGQITSTRTHDQLLAQLRTRRHRHKRR